MTTLALNAPFPLTMSSSASYSHLGSKEHTTTPALLCAQPEKSVTGTRRIALDELDDAALIDEIESGVEDALACLYQRYGRYAYTLAYRILRESAAAEDIVQEAFLAIWRKAGTYDQRSGSVRGWLQAIVHHRAVDKVRSCSLRDYQCQSLQGEQEQEPAAEHIEMWEMVWQQERARSVRESLDALPREQREIIELAYFGGLTHLQIAERLQIPLGTVKGRIRLGLQKMRQALIEHGLATE